MFVFSDTILNFKSLAIFANNVSIFFTFNFVE